MLFEDFDKKIKEAAEQHHPAYDEKAWEKMEKLLDKHLPQPKDDRRRIIFFVLLFLLVGGGMYLTISHPGSKSSQNNELAKENKVQVQASDKQQSVADKNVPNLVPEKNSNANDENAIAIDNGNSKSTSQQTRQSNTSNTSNKILAVKPGRNLNTSGQSTENNNTTNLLVNKSGNQDRNNVAEENRKDNKEATITDNTKTSTQTNLSPVAPGIDNKTDQNVVSNEKKVSSDQQTSTDANKPAQQKKTLNNRNGFGFFVSAGPDVSKAADSKMGKLTLVYGAGVSYTKDHITLRTGIFASKKIYWAGPDDYKLSFTPPPPTKFEGADANCDVVEIPVKFSYNFAMNEKSNWFASTGLSTYLMKVEKYVYTYKTSSGAYYDYPYVAKNENKHYFSILTISGGYTHRISRTVSLSAEPYVEVPLTGIGVGKVHLNSGGILFSIGVNPFKK
jgi:hypothetical protein